MTQQLSPWLEGAYGWNFGESGWNTGMDQNLLKFSFMFDRNVDSITAALPSAVNGQAHFLTTDNRLYFAVGTTYYSAPIPKWFVVTIKSTGATHQFNGTALVPIDSVQQLDTRLDAVELTVSTLGTAAFQNIEFFAEQSELDVAVANAANYTDALRIDLASTTDTTKGATLVGFKSPLTGAVASTVKDKAYGSVDILDFMTTSDRDAILSNDIGAQNRTTVTANINAAIATLSALGVKFDLSGMGRAYAVNGTVHIKNKITLRNCQFDHSSAVNDEAVVSMGDANGGNLVRPGKGIDLYVKTSSTATGVVGYRMDSLVRSSCYRDCFAEMNEKTTAPDIGSRGHIGFQIISTTIANAPGGGVGAYQNYIDGCTALAVHTGFDLRTRGTDVEAAADPQVNGNYLTNCFAYSCTSRALNLGLGAQENFCDVRADTFVTQTGEATRIDVIRILGNYNHVNFIEEIGSRADTQYSVTLGASCIYNEIEGATQNIVSGFLDATAIADGKRAKNIVRQVGSGLLSGGRAGQEISMSERELVPASSTTLLLKQWIAPSKCVVTKVMGRLDAAAPTGGSTFIYFGKNASYVTGNRLTWADSEASSVKSITVDTSAGVDINTQWVMNEGDTLNIAVTTPGGGSANVNATFFVRFI